MSVNILQIEESLVNLQDRRRHLDLKITSKFQSLAKFENIRTNSNARLHSAIIEQNERASIRNKDLLLKISQINATNFQTDKTKSRCLENLNEARFDYCKKMEAILPFYYRQSSIQLEEKVKMLKMEKMQSFQRRERLRLEMENEERAKIDLEQQRRELMVLRALEQQDVLRSEANYAMLREEGRFVDESIVQQFSLASRDLNRLVADSKLNNSLILERRHQHSEISALSQSPAATLKIPRDPLPPQSVVTEEGAVSSPGNSSGAFENTSRHFLPTLQSVIEASPSSSQGNSPAKAPQVAHYQAADSGEKVVHQIQFTQIPDNTAAASPQQRHSRLNSDTQGISSARRDPVDLPSFRADNQQQQLQQNRVGATTQEIVMVEEKKEEEERDGADNLVEEQEEHADARSYSRHISSSFTSTSAAEEGGGGEWANSSLSGLSLLPADPTANLNRQLLQVSTPPQSKTLLEDTALRPVPVAVATSSAEDLRLLLGDVRQCVVCVRQLFAAIEHRLMFSAHVTSIYVYASLDSTKSGARLSEIVQYVSLLTGGESSSRGERDRLLLEEFSGNKRLLGDTVLAIIQTHSSLLAPKEAFSGVVTLDKLKKEYKKGRSSSAVLELWEGLAQHLQKVMEVNSGYRADLSSCFVSALVSQVSDDDLDRFTRKVSNLIALILDSSASSSASPPPPPSFSAAQRAPLPGGSFSKPTRFISYDSMQLPSAKASEFEDEELMDDEVLERPPALRDIDHRAQRADDEFDF